MTKAMRLHLLIINNRKMTNDSLDRCVKYEKSMSLFNKILFRLIPLNYGLKEKI